MRKIFKLFLIIKSLIFRFFFIKASFINYFYSKSIFFGKNKIYLGSKNIFKSYSKISVDSPNNNEKVQIGNNNTFESFSIIRSQGGYISIGNNNFFGERVQVQGKGGVKIASNCMIAANTFVSSSNHNFSNPFSEDYLLKEINETTIIDDYTWIGANCTILAGIHIGHHSIIGAGSVVTKDIPNYHIAVGNPCRLIKKFDIKTQKWERL